MRLAVLSALAAVVTCRALATPLTDDNNDPDPHVATDRAPAIPVYVFMHKHTYQFVIETGQDQEDGPGPDFTLVQMFYAFESEQPGTKVQSLWSNNDEENPISNIFNRKGHLGDRETWFERYFVKNIWVYDHHQAGLKHFKIYELTPYNDDSSYTHAIVEDDWSARNPWFLEGAYASKKPRFVVREQGEFWATTFRDEIVELVFDIDNGKIGEAKPKTIATQNLINLSKHSQTMKFTVTETVTETATFSHEAGVAITAGMQFEAGFPGISKVGYSLEISASYAHTWGTEESTSESFASEFAVNAGAHSKVKCEATVQQADLEVPYTITLKSGRKSHGTWHGVSTWSLRHRCHDVELTPDEEFQVKHGNIPPGTEVAQ